jgi:hypothetical protein
VSQENVATPPDGRAAEQQAAAAFADRLEAEAKRLRDEAVKLEAVEQAHLAAEKAREDEEKAVRALLGGRDGWNRTDHETRWARRQVARVAKGLPVLPFVDPEKAPEPTPEEAP